MRFTKLGAANKYIASKGKVKVAFNRNILTPTYPENAIFTLEVIGLKKVNNFLVFLDGHKNSCSIHYYYLDQVDFV